MKLSNEYPIRLHDAERKYYMRPEVSEEDINSFRAGFLLGWQARSKEAMDRVKTAIDKPKCVKS